jgi:succinoglycan biosynthesis transport protein ExoP
VASEEGTAPGILPSIWRYRWQSLLIVVAFSAVSAAAGVFTAGAVTASSDVALTYPSAINVLSPGVSGDASLARYTQQRAAFATSDDVLDRVAVKVPGVSLSGLRKDIAVEPSAVANVMTITAQGKNAEAATSLANAAADAYREATAARVTAGTKDAVASYAAREREIEDELSKDNASPQSVAAATTLSQLQETTANLQTDSKTFADGVDFTRRAQLADATVPGPPIRQLALGVIVGLLVAAVVAWLRADRDRKISDASQPEKVLDAPLLATVPRMLNGRPAHAFSRNGASAPEPAGGFDRLPHPQYRLAAAVLIRRVSPGLVAVLGPPTGGDRSEATLNLAVSIALDGGRVLIVDADPHGIVTERLGLGMQLEGFGPPGQLPVGTADSVAWLSVQEGVSIGLVAPGPYMALSSPVDLRAFVEKLAARVEEYDLIVVDCPPAETGPLIPALLRACTGVLAVVPRGSEEREIGDIRRTADIFSSPVLGFVYTGARS